MNDIIYGNEYFGIGTKMVKHPKILYCGTAC
jgi:hypothetical protein